MDSSKEEITTFIFTKTQRKNHNSANLQRNFYGLNQIKLQKQNKSSLNS